MNVKTTWGSIRIDLIDGKVGGCLLPFLSAQPAQPFAIKQGEDDPISAFVSAVFSGKKIKSPSLNKLEGTDFQREVWRAIARIPLGQTQTYGELAQAIGRPNSVRAVGSACGKNPAPLFVPCHRIKAAHGGLGGFSAGLPWKQLLLSIEKSHSDLDPLSLHRRIR